MNSLFPTVGVCGTGAMGQGIAQMAAQAGSQVLLFDAATERAVQAQQAIAAQWQKMLDKQRITAAQHQSYLSALKTVDSLQALSACDLVIEAIIECLDAKVALFSKLEALVSNTTLLTTNTSSLSVNAIAAQLKHPQRLAGFHFFNPVPLMKVVEVIAGFQTSPQACQALSQYARDMGHTPVLAQDTPGFIVNHAGRAYNTEALHIAGEGVADFATIDRILRDQVGFKLGPFELFDLTALDVSHHVIEAIYHQYYEEPRYRPNVITAQRLAAVASLAAR
jgi:3-hydroxybutyryl-CoA dehydrogenase